MKVHDIAAGAVGVAVGAYALAQGARMPEDHIMKIGPSFFPSIVSVVLIGFSAFLALRGLLSREPGGFDRIDVRSPGFLRATAAIAAAVAYAILLRPAGFIPVTAFFILALMLVLGSRKPLDLVLVPPAATAGVWFVFERLLRITLPAGLMTYLGL